MKFSAVVVQLALTLSASAAILSSRAATAASNCPGSEIVSTRTIDVGGKSVILETFSCPSFGTAATKRSSIPIPIALPAERLRSRNPSQCTNTRECECGQQLLAACQDVTADGPNPNDCNVLIDGISILQEEAGSTFFTSAGLVNAVTFQSCAIAYTNTFTSTEEYCWDELASISSIINQQCFEANIGTSALIDSNDGKFTIELINVGT